MIILHNRVLVKEIENKQTDSGLFIVGKGDEQIIQAKVVGVGKGKWVGDTLIPLDVNVGDTVLFHKYSGTATKIDGENMFWVDGDDIQAVVE